VAGNQVGHRPEASRDLARALLATEDTDLPCLAKTYGMGTVAATREELVRSKLSLLHYEPKLDGALSRRVRDYLCDIGTKIRPDLSPDQATAWVDAHLRGFADLPPHVVTKACERACHVAFLFPSEVDGKVRELAAEHMERIEQAIRLADHLQRTIHEAAKPKPRLEREPPPKPGEKTITDTLVHTLQRDPTGAGRSILKLGLKLGYVAPGQMLPPDDPTLPQEDTP
jgi:hypothetical protein